MKIFHFGRSTNWNDDQYYCSIKNRIFSLLNSCCESSPSMSSCWSRHYSFEDQGKEKPT